jgi:hypothetical protein
MRAVAVAVKQRVRLLSASECVEHVFAGERGSERHRAACEQLCIARNVRLNAKKLRRRDCTEAPQTGKHLVCDQRNMLSSTDCSHRALERRVDENHARCAMHHGLDDSRAHFTVSMQRCIGKRRRNERPICLAERSVVTLCAKQPVLGEAQRIGRHSISRM